MTELLVLGGGPAGVTAALRARELGASVTLVERGRLGGTCTNDGCAPTRVLAKAARLAREAHQFDEYGLVGEPPTVDFAALMNRVQQTIYRLQEKKQLLSHLQQAGVTVRTETGDAYFVDPHTLGFANGTLQADKIILCVGGHARRMTLPGAELGLTHSDVWTLRKLPASVAIVGAAATGCQLASIFSAFGSHVTLLDAAPRILPGEDEAVSQTMTASLSAHGIEIISAIGGVDSIEETQTGRRLHYHTGDSAQTLETEAIMLATGWPGNTEELNLAAAGIETERGYIKVNDNLQTSAPHIFAAGDITGRMMLVQSADYEARAAAENAVLGPDEAHANAHHIVPHGGFTDPEYASVGLTEAKARELEPDCVVEKVLYAELDRAVIDGRPEGFCKLIVSRASHKLLGAHVVGEQAVEVVQIVAGGMAAGMTVTQLAELELAYPTYSAIVGSAARQLVREMNLVPLAPQWLALGRRGAEWERRDSV
jgi:pyruvate/2-oxoglutarate dehydrogenase complex dihydrolipoamide dehydrogenase (E3) component